MAQHLKCLQTELRAANMTWNFYAYGRTVHAFTLMENPIWNGSKSMVSHCSRWSVVPCVCQKFALCTVYLWQSHHFTLMSILLLVVCPSVPAPPLCCECTPLAQPSEGAIQRSSVRLDAYATQCPAVSMSKVYPPDSMGTRCTLRE